MTEDRRALFSGTHDFIIQQSTKLVTDASPDAPGKFSVNLTSHNNRSIKRNVGTLAVVLQDADTDTYLDTFQHMYLSLNTVDDFVVTASHAKYYGAKEVGLEVDEGNGLTFPVFFMPFCYDARCSRTLTGDLCFSRVDSIRLIIKLRPDQRNIKTLRVSVYARQNNKLVVNSVEKIIAFAD
jgi:hypothetical protein